jgi:hypothetical protein
MGLQTGLRHYFFAYPGLPADMTMEEFIRHELELRKPARILVTDQLARELSKFYLAKHPECLMVESEAPGIDFTLVGNALDGLDKQDAMERLGRLIRLSPVVLVIAQENTPLALNDFLALGMQKLYEPDSQGRSLYGFDLLSYKPAPDWLNSKYWAHPEQWKP